MVKVRLRTEDVDRAFRAIPEEFTRNMEKALLECCPIILKNIKIAYLKYFKIVTGEAIDSVFASKVTDKKIEIKINPKCKHAIYLHEGTKAHWIEPVEANALAWIGTDGKFKFSQGHIVSGIKGHKFLDEGLEISKKECDVIISKYLDKAFKKYFK